MANEVTVEVVNGIRTLYKTDPIARKLFDWTADRERDATSTSLDLISRKLGISRGEAVSLARKLEETKCGTFIVGRRGQKSRFEWGYNCISLGQAAAGELSELENVENPIAEGEDNDVERSSGNPASTTEEGARRLTIADAKAGLALSLGVPVSAIEIIVRG